MDNLRNAVIEIGWRINTRELERANAETDSMIDKASHAESGFRKTSKSVDGTASSLAKNSRALETNTSNVVEFGNRSERSFTSTTRSAKATDDQIQKIGDSAGESRSKVDGLEREFDESADSAKRLGNSASRSMKEIGDSAGGAGSKVKSIFSSAKERIAGVIGGFKNLSNEASGSASNIGSAIETGINKPLNIAKGIVGGLLATAGVSSASNLFSAGIDRLSAIENAQMSMEVMMGGDVDKAQGFMDEILAFAKTTPYAFTQLSTSAKNLFAYGMNQKDIVPTLQAIGDLSAASGKGSAGIDSLASAFGKMQVSGKASNEQLTQITEAGVPALKILGNQYGVTADEMREMVSSGEVSAKKAINGLVKGIADGTKGVAGETQALGGVMEKLKETWDGSLDSMKSSVTSTMATLLTPAKPHIQQGMAWFSDQFKKLPDLVRSGGKALVPLWEPTKSAFKDAKDFFVEDFIPTAKEVASEFGPGLLEGAKASIEVFSWTIENIVKPPLSWLRDYAEDHPDSMKKIGKYAAIGAAGFLAFNTIGKPILDLSGKITGFISLIAKIGDVALTSSGKTKLGFEIMGKSVPTSLPDTPTQQPASLLDEAGELIQSRSDRHKKQPSKMKKAAGWLFNGASTAEKATEQTLPAVARHTGKVTLGARAAGTVSSGLNLAKGAAKGAAKAVPGVSLIAAATNLIGMNKDNVGDKVGGSIGTMIGGAIGTKAATLAGAKFGALAGTIFGPVGTAVGGVLGTGIGVVAGSTIGKSIGSNIGKSIQNDWPAVEKKVKVLWEGLKKIPMFAPITIPIEANIKGIKAGIDGAKKLIDGTKEFFADPFEGAGEIEKTKGVSKETTKEVNKYLENYNEVSYASAKIKITGEPLTKQEFNDLMKSYDEMRDQVVDALEDRASKSTKNLDRLLELGVIDKDTIEKSKKAAEEQANANIKAYEEANNTIKALEKKRNDEVTKINEEAENKINQIREKARKENRELTDSENRQIEDIERGSKQRTAEINQTHEKVVTVIHENMKEYAVTTMSDSAKEQQIILGNLNNSSSELSAKQAASIVENSYKAKEETIKNANDKYEETKRILDEERYVSGTISQEKYEEALRIAKDERDGVVKSATETHDEVISKAKSQASGHTEQVNWETGETLSKWDVFKNDFSAKTTEIVDGGLKKWNQLATGTSEWFGKAGDWAVGEWNSFMTDLSIVVNKIIDGINVPLKFFGAKEMQHWTPTAGARANASGYQVSNASTSKAFNVGRSYYQGKRDSYEGDALVGEEGVELAYNKTTSSMRLLGANGPEVTHVSANEHILPHHKTKAILNGGLGAGTVLPGFSDGKGDLLGNIADIGSTVMNWITDPVGEIKALVDKHNKFQNEDNLEGMGWKAVTKVTDVAKEWAKNKFAEFAATFMSNGSHDGTMGGEGVYKYLYDIALKTMARYPGMSITSGYRPGDPYSHGKHQAIDIAYPASMNGSSKYMEPANWVFDNFPREIAYVITLGQVRDRSGMSGTGASGSWTRWPDNDHYDHLHINGALGSGEIKTGANTGVMGGAKIPGGSGVSRWSNLAAQALMMENVFNPLNLAAMLNQIRTESSGNPSTINNWDDNAKRGTPSKGLLQVIDPTFQTYKRPGYNDIWDPLSNMLASIRYVKATYGSITNGYRGVGYENGGFITREHQATVGEGNKPEVVIPLSSAKRSRGESLLQRTAEIFGLELKNKETNTAISIIDEQISKAQKAIENIHTPSSKGSNDKSFNIFGKETKPSMVFSPTFNIEVNGGSGNANGENIESRVKKAVQEATMQMWEQFAAFMPKGEV